jgi:tetratricopeptide (TPR) repeat protein
VATSSSVSCPSCGARNKPTWEFCARCNEPLEAVAATVRIKADDEAETPGVAEPGPAADAGVPANMILLAATLAFVVLGAAAWKSVASGTSDPGVDPSLFTMGTQPVALPTPPPSTAAGSADYEAGQRALHEGKLSEAVARLAAAVEADPENTTYQVVYGHALWRSGDRDAALAAQGEAARLDPRLSMQYARSLDVAGRTDEARAEYERILEQNPGSTTVREDLGRLLFRSGDYRGAAAHLQAAVQARPDDPVVQQELAYSLDQTGDRAQAAAVYRQVLEKAPTAALSRSLLAESLVQQGRKDEALAVLQEGLSSTPDVPLLRRQLGSVLERMGRPGEAAAAYRAYVAAAPNAADSQELAARAALLDSATKVAAGAPR